METNNRRHNMKDQPALELFASYAVELLEKEIVTISEIRSGEYLPVLKAYVDARIVALSQDNKLADQILANVHAIINAEVTA